MTETQHKLFTEYKRQRQDMRFSATEAYARARWSLASHKQMRATQAHNFKVRTSR